MEHLGSVPSPEIKKVDVFDEYSLQTTYVLTSLDGLDSFSQEHYQEVVLVSGRVVFVRKDIKEQVEKMLKEMEVIYRKLEDFDIPELVRHAHKVLRPFFKTTYAVKDAKKEIEEKERRDENREILITNREYKDMQRVEVAKFVVSFPENVQKSLREGAFLIDTEGRYSESVENGTESFASAESKRDFKSMKKGTWKKGILETLKVGSSLVKSFLPSNISGAYNTFRAELKDDTVTAIISGSSFSAFGDKDLHLTLEYEESGEKRNVSRVFKPF